MSGKNVRLNEEVIKEQIKELVRGSVEKTLNELLEKEAEHWTRIRANNTIERLNRENRWRTRDVGCFPNGNSALMLACARLRHFVGSGAIRST